MKKQWTYINNVSTICNKNNKIKYSLCNNEYVGYGNNSNENVNTIKLIDNVNPCDEKNTISGVLFDNKLTLSNSYIDTSDTATLEKHIKYIKKVYPSNYVCLALAGHGYTWYPRELLKNKNSYMDISNLTNVLSNVGGVDILVFDTCCGMSIECLYEFRKVCNILVGNMAYTGWKGLDENAVNNFLTSNPGILPYQLAQTMVNNFYPQLDGNLNYCISAYYTSIADIIRTSVCDISNKLIQWMVKNIQLHTSIIKNIRKTITYPDFKTGSGGNGAIDDISVDLLKLCIELNKSIEDYSIQSSTLSLINLLLMNKLSYKKTSDAFNNLSCISIYFPIKTFLKEDYGRISFNKDKLNINQNSWYTFLNLYFENSSQT